MNNPTDFLRKKFGPLKARNLKNAIAHQITTEFPRIGGPRICSLCAEMIMEIVNKHMRSRDHVKHGQVLWAAIDIKDPPRRRSAGGTNLVTVLLDLSTADDVQQRHRPPIKISTVVAPGSPAVPAGLRSRGTALQLRHRGNAPRQQ